METKYAALEAALAYKDDGLARRVIGLLAKTERNFVLKQGESTVELQRAKVDDATAHAAGAAVAALLGVDIKRKVGGG